MKKFNWNINYKPTVFKLLFLALIVFIMFSFTGEIYCDDGLIAANEINDGLIPVNESNYNTARSYNTSSWENNYQNRNIQETYPQYRNGQPIYQAYNEGLQSTPQGYRYELGGGSATININATNYSMEGKPLPLQYIGVDINGNPLYSYQYPSTIDSTQLGEINPVPNEVINSRFYEGDGLPKPPLNFSKPTLGEKIYNKVKVTVKNRFAKYNEPTAERVKRRNAFHHELWKEKETRRAQETAKFYQRREAQYKCRENRYKESYRKVRRFD